MLLTLHETGHSLGFQHNWNSSMNARASVMEYPTPRVKVTAKGELDLSEAYRAEPGDYDDIMVRYAYTEFAPGQGERRDWRPSSRRCATRS